MESCARRRRCTAIESDCFPIRNSGKVTTSEKHGVRMALPDIAIYPGLIIVSGGTNSRSGQNCGEKRMVRLAEMARIRHQFADSAQKISVPETRSGQFCPNRGGCAQPFRLTSGRQPGIVRAFGSLGPVRNSRYQGLGSRIGAATAIRLPDPGLGAIRPEAGFRFQRLLVPKARLELARYCYRGILKPLTTF